jgi:hypothetical protein
MTTRRAAMKLRPFTGNANCAGPLGPRQSADRSLVTDLTVGTISWRLSDLRMDTKPRRRWFSFSLRTLFVLVTLAALVVGWVAWSLNWIRQRREFVHRFELDTGILTVDPVPSAPGLLWLFGEKGVQHILLPHESEYAEAQRLFPEAQIIGVPEWARKGKYMRRTDRRQ